jgi:hypothetical protein
MKKLVLPIVMLLGGSGAGAAAGLYLLPPPVAEEEPAAVACPEPAATEELHGALPEPAPYDTPSAFVPLNNQFIVPVVDGDDVAALVILSLSLEVPDGENAAVLAAEPRLRDAFLQVLFDHANTGGFDGAFTASETMRSLRLALDAASQEILGDVSRNVLIIDIVRQDV